MADTKHSFASIHALAMNQYPTAFSRLPRYTALEFIRTTGLSLQYNDKALKVGYIDLGGFVPHPVYAFVASPNLVHFFTSSFPRLFIPTNLSRDAQRNIRFIEPFSHLREGETVSTDLVTSLVVFYFIAVSWLPFFEETEREVGSVSLKLLKRACELVTGAVDPDTNADTAETKIREGEMVRKRSADDSADEEVLRGRKRHLKDVSSEVIGELVLEDKYKAIMSRFKEACDAVCPADRSVVEKLKSYVAETLGIED